MCLVKIRLLKKSTNACTKQTIAERSDLRDKFAYDKRGQSEQDKWHVKP